MPTLPLLKFTNYFINTNGEIFKIVNGREVRVLPYRTPKSKDIIVVVENKPYNLLHLMTQHFHATQLKITDRVRFKVTKDLRIPAGAIRITDSLGLNGLTREEEAKMYRYKCELKASAANARCEDKISRIDVYRTLSIHGFKCVYCGYFFHAANWHLDHFASISKGGKNKLENIVPSCDVCNIMKGAMEGNQFYTRCLQITRNYMFKSTIEEMKVNCEIAHQKNLKLKEVMQ